MQYGLCTGTVAEDAQGIGTARVAQAAAMGFDYVEMPLAQMMALSEEDFREGPLRAVREAGIPSACCNNFFPASVRLTGPNADHALAKDYTARALDRAALLGTRRVVFGSGGARNVPDGFPVAEASKQLTALLAELGPIAAARNIVLVIEPLNRLESNILNSLAEGLAMARAVAHPSVACLVDFYHAGLSGDATAALEASRGYLRHVHLARIFGRAMPVLADEEPYRPFFAGLRAIGYDEGISLEALAKEDFARQTCGALKLMQELAEATM